MADQSNIGTNSMGKYRQFQVQGEGKSHGEKLSEKKNIYTAIELICHSKHICMK